MDYTIKPQGQKLLDNFRGDRIYGDLYIVVKEDQGGNTLGLYEVTISGIGDWCNCPGFQRWSKCKHMQMVFDFIKEEESHENTQINHY